MRRTSALDVDVEFIEGKAEAHLVDKLFSTMEDKRLGELEFVLSKGLIELDLDVMVLVVNEDERYSDLLVLRHQAIHLVPSDQSLEGV